VTSPSPISVIANQCWLYFDKVRTVPEVRRVLKPTGVLVTSHFNFMPRADDIVRQSEELVLRYNPSGPAVIGMGSFRSNPNGRVARQLYGLAFATTSQSGSPAKNGAVECGHFAGLARRYLLNRSRRSIATTTRCSGELRRTNFL
jgi:hypothetical protein